MGNVGGFAIGPNLIGDYWFLIESEFRVPLSLSPISPPYSHTFTPLLHLSILVPSSSLYLLDLIVQGGDGVAGGGGIDGFALAPLFGLPGGTAVFEFLEIGEGGEDF